MEEERILFIREDPVLKKARERSSKNVHFDPAKQVYAFYEPGIGIAGRVVTYELRETYVQYDRAIDLRPPKSMQNLNDPAVLLGLKN